MSPRSSAEVAALNRDRIVRATVARSSTLGLEGVTVRELALDVGMSKSGVLAPFGTRADLLADAFDGAIAMFRAAVIVPVLDRPAGPERLAALLERWVDYLLDCPFPGGCFLTTASVEFDNRPGPLRERTAATMVRWLAFLADEARAARPELTARQARDLATALNGVAMATNQAIQLLDDPEAGPQTRRLMRALVAAPA